MQREQRQEDSAGWLWLVAAGGALLLFMGRGRKKPGQGESGMSRRPDGTTRYNVKITGRQVRLVDGRPFRIRTVKRNDVVYVDATEGQHDVAERLRRRLVDKGARVSFDDDTGG